MTSLSPEHYGSHQSQSPSDATGQDKSPMQLDMLKSLSEKKTTREGNAPKRRGPKPDSKPALTRRQELNRQAQRTHRERKELYIKALEDEVLRLKEIYSSVAQEREKLVEENRLLKEALTQSGLQVSPTWRGGPGNDGDDAANAGGNGNNGSFNFGTGGSNNIFSPGQTSNSNATTYTASPGQSQGGYNAMSKDQLKELAKELAAKGIDIEQAGIDFVLALEKPCMSHIPYIIDLCSQKETQPCGHALMATYPPATYKELENSEVWGSSHTEKETQDTGPAQGTWEISKADLSTLLDLSGRLDLDGEITPVMAWGMIMNHPRFVDFKQADFAKLAEELRQKVRCYGFGAVMEDFELRDAIANVRTDQLDDYRVQEMAY